MSKRRHMPEQKQAQKSTRSPFITYCVTTVCCILICAVGFTFLVFGNDNVFKVSSDQNTTTANVDLPISFEKTIHEIEQDKHGGTHLGDIDSGDPDIQPQPQNPYVPGGGAGGYADQIITRMISEGYNYFSIAGALGSFVAESGLNPATTQGHACDGADNATVRAWQGGKSGRAIGFAQWDGGRATSLLNAADAAGVNWYDFDFQLNYFINDLAGNGCSVSTYNSNSSDVEHAAWWFTHKYERCGINKSCPGYNVPNKYCASQIGWDEREYANGWSTRLGGAQNFYDTYF